MDVVVGEHGVAGGDGIPSRLELMGTEVARLERVVGGELLILDIDGLDGLEGGGQIPVVEQRRVEAEPLFAHQLLGVEATLGVFELGVPFRWDLADAAVVGHRYAPRVFQSSANSRQSSV